jgi:hypothetical protein
MGKATTGAEQMSHITISLPWPDASLFPNRSNGKHWSQRQPAKSAAKLLARAASYDLVLPNVDTDHAIKIIVAPPDKRRRDVDGILSALKPSLDSIAEVLRIDDVHFNPIEIVRVDPVESGNVTIVIDDGIPF